MKVDERGTMLYIRAVSRAMLQQEPLSLRFRNKMERPLGRGSIVNVSSGHNEVSPGEFLPYSTPKHAVGGITGAVGGFAGAGAMVGLSAGTGGCLKLRILQSIAFASTTCFLPR